MCDRKFLLLDIVRCNSLSAYIIREITHSTNLRTTHDVHSIDYCNLVIEPTMYTYCAECTYHGVGVKEKWGALALL